jgi:hypothetical protein
MTATEVRAVVLSGLNNFEVRAVASCVELVLAESSPTILGLKVFVGLQKWKQLAKQMLLSLLLRGGYGTSHNYKLLAIISY